MSEQESGGEMRPDEGVAPPSALSAGEQLAAAREARGWSIEDVASQLNLAPRQVHAIEAGNHAALPGMPITRGFIRAYAKLLKIDAAPLLSTLGGDTAAAPVQTDTPRKVIATPFAESRMPSLGERKRSPLPVFAIVAVVVLCAAGYWLLQNRDLLGQIPAVIETPATSVQAPAAAPQPQDEPVAEPGVAAPGAEAPAPASADAVEAPASPDTAPPKDVSGDAAPTPPTAALSSSGPAAADAAPVQAVPAAAVNPAEGMQLSAREETWVEVRRNNGNTVVLSRLLKPGETQTVAVTEPLTVVIGNAGGVDLTLRGAPVPLKGGNGNVSKITVK